MKLQILVPQYNESEQLISRLLDSIQLQQGIILDTDVGVIIVNDGSHTFLSDEFLEKYDFPIEYHKDPHRGIPGTRNALLRYATADYVMFCDADDMFCSLIAVYSILRSANEGEFDELICYFYNEAQEGNAYPFYSEHTRVIHPFIHGKVFNRKYLVDNNIWFNEEVNYHEDVYFSFIAHSCAVTIKLLQQYAYIWKFNPNSVTHGNNFAIKNYCDSLHIIACTADELLRRDKLQDAQFYYTCCLYNTYFFMHQPQWKAQRNTKHWHKICVKLQDMWNTYGAQLFEAADPEWREKVWEDTADSSWMMTDMPRDGLEPFEPWLHSIVDQDYSENEDENA